VTKEEIETIEACNREMIVNAAYFREMLGLALHIAIYEHNDIALRKLALMAEHWRDHLARYIALFNTDAETIEQLNPIVLALHDYYVATASDIHEALKRQPEDGDEWKAGG
jgi:hypothetical protein